MASQYQLVMRTGPTPGATYALEDGQITIGRDPSNSISINDSEVSRNHARMNLQGGKFVLEDLGSTNGTMVNGKRITGPHVLKPGEMISFGEQIVLMYEVLNFDPDATVASVRSQPAAAPRQQPVATPPPPQAYAGQVPPGPAPTPAAPPVVSPPKKRNSLPIVLGVGALVLLCACGAFFWW
ncbi:MAG: FHA domain-containing protein, partial [Anaerolineales bacterium]|nr:FHA domain-containing protein [Anaerolineales bacterium]